jgi:hypothetical protein
MPINKVLYRGGCEHRKTDFHYESAVGQLNYLSASTWPGLMVDIHQCVCFSVLDPRLQHEQAIK